MHESNAVGIVGITSIILAAEYLRIKTCPNSQIKEQRILRDRDTETLKALIFWDIITQSVSHLDADIFFKERDV